MADTKTGAAATSEGANPAAGTGGAAATTDAAAGKTSEGTGTGTTATGDPATPPAAGDQVTGEKGSEGKTGDETGDTAAAAAPAAKVPEKYSLTVPEGGAAYVDDADLKRLEEVARASEWTNEDAQAALEEHISTIKAQSDRWAAETSADPEYGGEKLVETQRLAKAAIDRLRPAGHARRDAFLRFMGRGGAGNHIEVVSFLADLGKLMSEDAPGATRPASPSPGDAASRLYDHPTSKV
jgi:hypothetical protein